MTPEKIRALVNESGGDYSTEGRDVTVVVFTPAELEVYTAAVEAEERVRIMEKLEAMQLECSAYTVEAIRSL